MGPEQLQRTETNRAVRSALDDLDLHVPGERAHAERTAVHAVAVGFELGLSDEDLFHLRCAAQLHDIGKLLLPADLLRRGEALTAGMRAEAERHSTLGMQALTDRFPHMAGWLERVAPSVVHHHERWDGAGYPALLAGDGIPLGAQVIGCCEAFDVACFGVYQAPRGKEGALAMVRSEAGTHFSPSVVHALVKVSALINPVC